MRCSVVSGAMKPTARLYEPLHRVTVLDQFDPRTRTSWLSLADDLDTR